MRVSLRTRAGIHTRLRAIHLRRVICFFKNAIEKTDTFGKVSVFYLCFLDFVCFLRKLIKRYGRGGGNV